MIFVGFFAFWVVVTSNSWCILRILESVPGPQLADTELRNDPEVSGRSGHTPSPALQYVLYGSFFLFLKICIYSKFKLIDENLLEI